MGPQIAPTPSEIIGRSVKPITARSAVSQHRSTAQVTAVSQHSVSTAERPHAVITATGSTLVTEITVSLTNLCNNLDLKSRMDPIICLYKMLA